MNKIKNLLFIIRFHGLPHLLNRVFTKILKRKIKGYAELKRLFEGKSGIEIGGPSGIFRDNGFIPLYQVIRGLDGCNFSGSTIWEGTLKEGETYSFHPDKKKGFQFLCEGADLSAIPSEKYDFLISSNCLEHVANPLKAVKEWARVTKWGGGGYIILVLPNKKYCFDHRRPVTLFSHLLDDYQKSTGEDDLTHLPEILELHDLRMDPAAGSFDQFKARSLKNFENRALHHHVYDTDLLKQIFDFCGIETLQYMSNREHIIIGRKK